jgi:hypothetical protein
MISYEIKDKSGVHVRAQKGLLTKNLMYKLGQGVRAVVVKLTNEGRDYRGKRFPAYSKNYMWVAPNHKPSPQGGRRKHKKTKRRLRGVVYDRGYLQYRVAHGRSPKVDLQLTGNMLANFQIVSLNENRVKLGFPSKRERNKAIGNITGRRGRSKRRVSPRPFVGVGKKHEAFISAELKDHVKRETKRYDKPLRKEVIS